MLEFASQEGEQDAEFLEYQKQKFMGHLFSVSW